MLRTWVFGNIWWKKNVLRLCTPSTPSVTLLVNVSEPHPVGLPPVCSCADRAPSAGSRSAWRTRAGSRPWCTAAPRRRSRSTAWRPSGRSSSSPRPETGTRGSGSASPATRREEQRREERRGALSGTEAAPLSQTPTGAPSVMATGAPSGTAREALIYWTIICGTHRAQL